MQRALLTSIVVLLAASPAAWARDRAKRGSDNAPASTFNGQCQFTGTVTFTPGLALSPQTLVEQNVSAPGTCSGTFTGRDGQTQQLSGTPVTYTAIEQAPNASCAGGTAAGSGALVFAVADGDSSTTNLYFNESEDRAGVFVVATATGAEGGSARGEAAPTSNDNPFTAAQDCAGSSIPSAEISINLATTPSISG